MNIEWGSVADWVSAVATFSAVVTSLYLANRSMKPKVEILTNEVNISDYEQESADVITQNDGIEIVVLCTTETPVLLKSCHLVKRNSCMWILPSVTTSKEELNDFFYNSSENELQSEVNFMKPLFRVVHKKELLEFVGQTGGISSVRFIFTDFKGRKYETKNLKRLLKSFEKAESQKDEVN